MPKRQRHVSLPISIVIRIAPIVSTVRWFVRGVLRVFGVRTDPDTHILAVREEIAGAPSLAIPKGLSKKRIGIAFWAHWICPTARSKKSCCTVQHRNDQLDDDPQAILTQCLEARIRVYKDDPSIIGVIHAKDLARQMYRLVSGPNAKLSDLAKFDINEVAMEPYFIPDTTSLDDQMRQFLRRRTFALVVDEYQSLEALITLEDILEEIAGEIADEFDTPEDQAIKPDTLGRYTLDGAMTIRDLNRALDWSLPDDEANTLAGLVIHEAQMIPTVGQIFPWLSVRGGRTSGQPPDPIARHAHKKTVQNYWTVFKIIRAGVRLDQGRFGQNCAAMRFAKDHHLNPITRRCVFHVSKRKRHANGIPIGPRCHAANANPIFENRLAPCGIRVGCGHPHQYGSKPNSRVVHFASPLRRRICLGTPYPFYTDALGPPLGASILAIFA